MPHADWAERLVEALQRGADAVTGTTLSGMGALADASELVAHALPRHLLKVAISPLLLRTILPAHEPPSTFDDSYPDAAGEDRDW